MFHLHKTKQRKLTKISKQRRSTRVLNIDMDQRGKIECKVGGTRRRKYDTTQVVKKGNYKDALAPQWYTNSSTQSENVKGAGSLVSTKIRVRCR